jgi:hypothetical protein
VHPEHASLNLPTSHGKLPEGTKTSVDVIESVALKDLGGVPRLKFMVWMGQNSCPCLLITWQSALTTTASSDNLLNFLAKTQYAEKTKKPTKATVLLELPRMLAGQSIFQSDETEVEDN